MITFKQFVLREDNIAGSGGVFGAASSMGHGGDVGNSDFYAPGTAIIPKPLGIKKVKNHDKKILVQRRSMFKYF
jgi:hypothetical protein